jgi:hypothetical protein
MVLVGRLEGEIALLRPVSRWKNNIKVDLQDTGWGGMDLE